jgi:hypothetical protein
VVSDACGEDRHERGVLMKAEEVEAVLRVLAFLVARRLYAELPQDGAEPAGILPTTEEGDAVDLDTLAPHHALSFQLVNAILVSDEETFERLLTAAQAEYSEGILGPLLYAIGWIGWRITTDGAEMRLVAQVPDYPPPL